MTEAEKVSEKMRPTQKGLHQNTHRRKKVNIEI